jgi:hypothetical protein
MLLLPETQEMLLLMKIVFKGTTARVFSPTTAWLS